MSFRGLRNFIAEIRATITFEDECKIVEEEKAKIRQNFASPSSTSYDRRKYCLKLMYMHVLGHPVDFGLLQASQLMASKTKEEKLVGYIVLGELLQDNKDFLRLVTQTVMYDIQQVNEFSTPLALTFVANTANAEMAEVVAPQIMQLLTASRGSAVTTYIKKKAALALLHCYRVNPDSVDTEPINKNLIDLLDAHNVGFLNCMVHLLAGISDSAPEVFETTKSKAIYLLGKIVLKKEVSADHQYYTCPCPWLIISLMKFLRHLSPDLEDDVSDPVQGVVKQKDTLENVIKECFRMTASLSSAAPTNKQNIYWALAHEAGLLANFYSQYFDDKVDIDFMIKAIVSKDSKPNVRFAAMNTLASMSRMVSVSIAIRMNIVAIVETISQEMDFSLRGKGQVLLFNSADSDTAEGVVACLLGGARATRFPLEYREDSLLRAAILCERHGLYTTLDEDGASGVRDTMWTVRSMIRLLPTATDLALRFVWQNLANAIMMKIVGIEDMELKADVLYELLSSCFTRDSIVAAQNGGDPNLLQVVDDPMILTVACYVITESIYESFGAGYAGVFYGLDGTEKLSSYSTLFGNEAVFMIVSQAIMMLQNSNFKEEVPVAVSAMIALCYIGICPMQNLQLLTVSPITEVQQRAIEAYAIMQLTDRDMVANLLQQTPVLTEVRGLESRLHKDNDEEGRKKEEPVEEEVEEPEPEAVEEAPAAPAPAPAQEPAAAPDPMDMMSGAPAAPQAAPAPAAPAAAPASGTLDDLLDMF